jgi:hypothetical protein
MVAVVSSSVGNGLNELGMLSHEASVIAATVSAETRMIVNRRNFMAAIQSRSAVRRKARRIA